MQKDWLTHIVEYPPNMGHSTGMRFEDRMCWMTVGTVSRLFLARISIDTDTFHKAVRLGYLLGLEQLVMQPDDIEEKSFEDRGRGKVVWSCKAVLRSSLNEIMRS